eukprot:679200-Prorocentrum_minimum.AAC.1
MASALSIAADLTPQTPSTGAATVPDPAEGRVAAALARYAVGGPRALDPTKRTDLTEEEYDAAVEAKAERERAHQGAAAISGEAPHKTTEENFDVRLRNARCA